MQAQLEAPALVQEAHPVGTNPSLQSLNPRPRMTSLSLSLLPLKKAMATNWFSNFQK